MKILVTGGAGYIGSITVEQLVKAGERVVVFDNLYQGHRAAVHPEAAFIKGDLIDAAAIEDAIATHRPDAIMHFAGNTLVGESMQEPLKYVGDNTICFTNLMRAALKHDVNKVIISSTANLFDQPVKLPIDEDEHLVPGSPYGESKYFQERILYWLEKTKGLRYGALRYFNASGASEERGEDHSPEMHLIPIVLEVALGKRDRLKLFGDDYPTPDGSCVRDYVHVIDLAEAHILALRALDGGSRIYNLGNGTGFSNKQVIETARAVTGHPIPYDVVERRPGDPATLIASSDKIRRELGWNPRYDDLHSIISSAWKWHQSHPNGYDDHS